MDVASHDSIAGFRLGVVAFRLALVGEHVIRHGRRLDDGVVRREVALEDGDAALLAVRRVDAVDDVAVEYLGVLDAVADRARHRERVEMDEVLRRELMHDGGDAARLVEVDHVMLAGRAEFRDVRRAARDLIEERRGQVDAGLVRDGRQMQHRVRRAADAHVDRDGILERLAREDVTRLDVLLEQIHHDGARALREQAACARVGRRDRAIARQAHAEHLGQRVHRVRREESRAGAAARAAFRLELMHLRVRHVARRIFAGRLERLAHTHVAAMEAAGEHRAAGDDDRRNIEPRRRHEHARHDLVTVRDEDERVKSGSHRDRLDGVGDELAARERVFHARMAHRDAVADTDGRELQRRAAGGRHAELRRLSDLTQMDVARDDLIEGIADADERLLEILLTVAVRMEQRTMRTTRGAFLDNIASHKQRSSLSNAAAACRSPRRGGPPRRCY